MRSSQVRMLLTCLLIPLSVSAAAAADTGYFSVKGGLFLPNSTGGDNGLKDFNSGFNSELAIGFRPESYAAIELGTGYYRASGTVDDADHTSRKTIYGVPVTVTAKAILDLDKFELFGGAGLGYYFAFIDQNLAFKNAGTPVQESSHGSALGYHLVLGGDYKVSERMRVGADFKYFAAKPEFQLTDATGNSTKAKWDIGGTVMNLGFKYLY